MNSLTDTLPHNSNNHLWEKIPSSLCNLCGQQQTLLHVLNTCPYALEKRRYNDRHNVILESIYTFLKRVVPSCQTVTADLPNLQYSFPQHIACTDRRPDIVVWSQSIIVIIKLIVPFELCFNTTVTRKTSRYSELLNSCKEGCYRANLISLLKLAPEAS